MRSAKTKLLLSKGATPLLSTGTMPAAGYLGSLVPAQVRPEAPPRTPPPPPPRTLAPPRTPPHTHRHTHTATPTLALTPSHTLTPSHILTPPSPSQVRTVYNASMIAARPVRQQQQVALLLVMGYSHYGSTYYGSTYYGSTYYCRWRCCWSWAQGCTKTSQLP